MATKQVGSVYLVDCRHFTAGVLKKWRATLPENKRSSSLVKVKLLGLFPGTRSYECEVLGASCTVKLSSKTLADKDASTSRQQAPKHSERNENDDASVSGDESSGLDEEGSVEEEDQGAVDATRDDFARLCAADWQPVAAFDDPLTKQHPDMDVDRQGRLRGHVPKTPCDLLLAFFPMELVEAEFPRWQQHAEEHGRRGLALLDKAMFLRFLALLVKMGLTGLRRREMYWHDPTVSTAMSLRTFENLLYTIRDAGFKAYEEGHPLPDGREAVADDPLKLVRRFVDELQAHWQEVYVPGSLLVADETMVGWKGATNIHITTLPNKPTSKGVCLKTLVDGHTRVMMALEFVESKEQQGLKRYAEEGRAAAVCLRLTEPWHNQIPRTLLADAWFGGLLTSVGLMRRGLFSITNVKTHTKHFCKKELWVDARCGRAKHERDDRAYRQLVLKVNGTDTTFTGAFHMDRAPMTLLGTAGSSQEAPPVMRRRVFMSDEGDLVRWTGELKQPDIHYIYRSHFNAVDVHNKLAVGPRSVNNVGANHLMLKLWLSMVAIAETNAYLTYVNAKKLTSDQYSHPDFKVDLVHELLQRAQQTGETAEEEGAPRTRGSIEQVATGGESGKRLQMPPTFRGHTLTRDQTKNRKCMVCGTFTKTLCSCGRAICGSQGGVTCWAWHLEAVSLGTDAEEPMHWPRGKRPRA